MKKLATTLALLTLALALLLTQLACAEPSEAVRGIYDALLAEGSAYSDTKVNYTGYFPEAVFEETLEDDGFTIAIGGTEYMDGSWTFTRDGDCLTATFADGDFAGMGMTLNVIEAVGAYLGMNTSLINSYVNGLSALGIESGNFSIADDEAAGTTTVRMNIAAPWDMKELDEMVFDDVTLDSYDPLGEEFTSMGGGIGKLRMVANGSANDLTVLLGEYGELDELAYRSIVNIVNRLQPAGWEDFIAGYTGLADAEGAGWSVRLNADEAAVGKIIDDIAEGFSYAIVHFGA